MLPNARVQQLLLLYAGDWDPDEADHQSIAEVDSGACSSVVAAVGSEAFSSVVVDAVVKEVDDARTDVATTGTSSDTSH